MGQLLSYQTDKRHFKRHYSHFIKNEQPIFIKTEIDKVLKPTKNYRLYTAQIFQVNHQKSIGKILVKAPKKLPVLKIGQQLKILTDSTTLKPIPKKTNPFSFDYQKFMSRNNIYHQINLQKNGFSITPQSSSFYLVVLANHIRQNIKRYLKKSALDKQTYNLAITLLLGERQNLSKDIYKTFQTAGTVHILAISGLHIGILLIFLNFLFKPTKRYSNILFLIITLSILWFYAFLTGFSPSVLRAVIMFSFLQIGLQSKRQTNIYNSLFIAAFVMLLINPSSIYQIGFQMSFMAVLSIVSFYPIFSRWLKIKNKFLKWWVDLFWVSLAAQLGVFPLTLFYFHQFPIYFFIANLIVIPLLFPILFLGFILIALSFTGFEIPFLFKIFHYLLNLLLQINTTISEIPNALLTNISFYRQQFVLCLIGLLLLYRLLKHPKSYQNTVVFLSWLLLFQLSILQQKFIQNKTAQYYVFHQFKTSVTARSYQNKLIVYQDSSLVNHYLLKDLKKTFQQISFKKPVFSNSFQQSKILHIDSLCIYNFSNYKPDIIVLHYSPKINIERLIKLFQPKILVAGASNYPSYIKHWQQTAKNYQISFYNVNEQGAFILK